MGNVRTEPETQLNGPIDRTRINVWEPSETRYWARYFRVSETELEETVRAVGYRVQDVQAHLER